MHTLRARLVAALLAVATTGLLALAGITYAEQRSYLEHRVDDQARAAIGAVQRSPRDGGGDRAAPPPRTRPCRSPPPGNPGPRPVASRAPASSARASSARRSSRPRCCRST